MDQKSVAHIRREYPLGVRVELRCSTDARAPAVGTQGRVKEVKDDGTVVVSWDDGLQFPVNTATTVLRNVDEVVTVCHGERRIWRNRKDAQACFLCMMAEAESEDAARYKRVYDALQEGKSVCSDAV